jgi:cytochrome P450
MAVLTFADLPGVSEAQVLVEIGTFFIAGMDTTAHTLAFFMYCLAKHGDVQTKCQQEVDKLLSTSSLAACAGTLPPYVEAVLKECMRKFPVAAPGSVRYVKQAEGFKLNDQIHLPQGWWIQVNLLALHSYEGNWGPDSEKFVPDRWLDATSSSIVDDVDPLEASSAVAAVPPAGNPLASAAAYGGAGNTRDELSYAPFSYGMRNCVGMNLALMELRVSILNLVSRFDFHLGDKSMEDESTIAEIVFIMRPTNGLPMMISKRSVAK